MEKLNACPVCDEPDFEPFLTTSDYFLTGEAFSIDKCLHCGFLFTNPRPSETSISAYYKSDDYISHSNTDKGFIARIYKLVRNHTLNQKRSWVTEFKKKGKALDIGCGTGHFLNHLAHHGFEVRGVEPEPAPRKFAVQHFNLKVESGLPELMSSPGAFDVISMWHVLEHVFNLNDYIRQIKSLLCADGVLFVAVPNPASYDARHYGKYWAAYDLPRHLYHFTRTTMEQLFSKHDFKLEKIIPMKFDAFYVSLLSEKYKHGKNNFLPAFSTGLKSNFMASHPPGNFSSLTFVLKQKK